MKHLVTNKSIISWALYDWANSAYATVVLAGFFPLFFKQYWSAGLEPAASTFQLGAANSLASAVIVILAPLLGSIADAGKAKKKMLLAFAMLGVLMTGALYFVAKGDASMALLLFGISAIGFSGSIIFYDSLIVDICEEKDYDKVSALGFSMGYLGGGILFAITVMMTLKPDWFGFADKAEAVRVSFLCVAAWWTIFSLPIMLNVHEKHEQKATSMSLAIRRGFRQLIETFNHIRQLRVVAVFLLAYWLYIDGVDTIVRMAVDYGMSLGFDPSALITALLITQFVGFPAAVAFGFIGEKIGARQGILIAIVVYLLVTLWASQMQSASEFYGLAIVIGLVQGGIQSLSRSLYARLIPASRAAEFFGFYNMLGKFAAVLGPLMVGAVSLLTGSARASILSVSILFIAGGLLLWRVDVQKGIGYAKQYETENVRSGSS